MGDDARQELVRALGDECGCRRVRDWVGVRVWTAESGEIDSRREKSHSETSVWSSGEPRPATGEKSCTGSGNASGCLRPSGVAGEGLVLEIDGARKEAHL